LTGRRSTDADAASKRYGGVMNLRAALVSFILAAACSTPPTELPPPELPQRAGVDPIIAARAEGVTFRALGANPDFLLHIFRNNERIFLAWDNGAHQEMFTDVQVTLPAYRGTIYEAANEGRRLRVEVREAPCRDAGVSGERFSAIVIVSIDGEERRGCGRVL
jgi:hypothetical protein